MLSVSGLNQFYGESHILWDIELKLPPGSCTCLMGRNGVGKTTLLRTIMGLVPARSGTISFEDKALTRAPAHARALAGIGYVPQGREIFSRLSVEENLEIGLYARRDGRRTVPDEIFALFPVLRDMRKRRGGDLSGGQQQQLAIGRALACDPKLLILDEPTEGIQPNLVHEIGEILVQLNRERRIAILLVEQKVAFARRVADQFCIMEKGRIVGSGEMTTLDSELIQRHLTV
jgi:urea transport system ATP-binding protein